MVKFYGCYLHNGRYNVLLEYANFGTLEDYFSQVNTPRSGRDIVVFWEGLLQILEPLMTIHDLNQEAEDSDSKLRQFLG